MNLARRKEVYLEEKCSLVLHSNKQTRRCKVRFLPERKSNRQEETASSLNSQDIESTAKEFYDSLERDAKQDERLAWMLADYKRHLEQTADAKEAIAEMQASERDTAMRIWKLEPDQIILRGKCGDNMDVEFECTGQVATLQTAEVDQLREILRHVREDANVSLFRQLYEAKLSRILTQAYVDDTLWALNHRPDSKTDIDYQNESSLSTKDSESRNDDVVTLERMLNTLFAAQRRTNNTSDAPVKTFTDDLQTWIMHIGGCLIRLASISERKFILLHLLQFADSMQWARCLLQYQWQSHDHFAEEYISALRLLFDRSLHAKDPRWLEDDYLLALDQMAIVNVYENILDDLKGNGNDVNNLEKIFTFSNELLSVLSLGVLTFQQGNFSTALKRLAQTTSKISHILAESFTQQTLQAKQQYQHDFDHTIRLVVDIYLEADCSSAWHFLPSLPFQAMSVHSLWKLTLTLLRISNEQEPLPLEDVLKDFPDVSEFLQFLSKDQVQGIFTLSCLTSIVTSLPIGAGDVTQNADKSFAASTIAVIAHTLFNVAFVDENLRDTYYKDVRDNFGPICACHPFVISLLLRWTSDHFSQMEGMALYLFRSLPLEKWKVLKEDLILLHPLLCESPVNSLGATFARYLIENINFGYSEERDASISKSQSWSDRRSPFVRYEIHEEMAFLLLDAAQRIQPLPDSDSNLKGSVASAISSLLPNTTTFLSAAAAKAATLRTSMVDIPEAREFIDWIWNITLRLKLYDCPISSRASDIEKTVSASFLKDMLQHSTDTIASHASLLVYICFMLSPTSRHFLRFESADGWGKMFLVLKRGKAEAVLRMFAEIVPAFVYMHGDDFFNDPSLANFLRQMVNLKADPMLTDGALSLQERRTLFGEKLNGVSMTVLSHVWHGNFIDSVSNMMDDKGHGFSYRDLILHSWLKTLFMKQEWMWSEHYVKIMDSLCMAAFCLSRHQLIQEMLRREQSKLEKSKHQDSSSSSSSPNLGPAGGQSRNPLRFIKTMLPDTAYKSLLAGEWSLMSLTANNIFKTAGVEQSSLWFAFYTLLMETADEREIRQSLQVYLAGKDLSNGDVNIDPFLADLEKPIDFLCIYRWLQHILTCPPEHPLLPAYLQMFFSLYFSCIQTQKKRLVLGPLFFEKKHDLLSKLRDRIAFLQSVHGQKCTEEKDTESGHGKLRRLYYAMWLWLGNADLENADFDVDSLPAHYYPEKLQACRTSEILTKLQEQPAQFFENIWVAGRKALENEFCNYVWIGAEKFQCIGEVSQQREQCDSKKSSSSVKKRKAPTTNQVAALPHLQLTRPAQTPSAEDLVSSPPEDLLGSMIGTMKYHALCFQNHVDVLTKLDQEYLQHLTKLFVCKPVIEQIKASCAKGNKGCKKLARWETTVQHAQQDPAVKQLIDDNRYRAEAVICTAVDARICIQSMLLYRLMDAIERESKNSKRRQVLIDKAWDCLSHALQNLKTELEYFPPVQNILHRIGQTLCGFIGQERKYLDKFLSMLENMDASPRYIRNIFQPHADFKQLVKTYSRVCQLHSQQQLDLLPNFDMVAWAQSPFATDQSRNNFYHQNFLTLKQCIEKRVNEQLTLEHFKLALSLMNAADNTSDRLNVLERLLNLLENTQTSVKRSHDQRSQLVDAYIVSLGGLDHSVVTSKLQTDDRMQLDNLPQQEIVPMLDLLGAKLDQLKQSPTDVIGSSNAAALRTLIVHLLCDVRLENLDKDLVSFYWRNLCRCYHPWLLEEEQEESECAIIYHHLVRRRLGSLHSEQHRSKLLHLIFAFYHDELLRSRHSGAWLTMYAKAVCALDWSDLEMSRQQLERVRQTYGLLSAQRQDTDQKKIQYLIFILQILSRRIQGGKQFQFDRDQTFSYTLILFIFAEESDELWHDQTKRLEELQLLKSPVTDLFSSLDTEQAESIVNNGLWRSWMTPIPSPSTEPDTPLSIVIQWVQEMAGFNYPSSSVKRRRIFSDYIATLLSACSETPVSVEEEWIVYLYDTINEYAVSKDTDELGSTFQNLFAIIEKWDNIQNIFLPKIKESKVATVTAVFGAVAGPSVSASRVAVLESCLERCTLQSKGGIEWENFGRLLWQSKADTTLLLQRCMEQSANLTIRAYAQLKYEDTKGNIQQLVGLVEELAAVISIAQPTRSTVYLVQFFAALFREAQQDEKHMLACIVSLSKTASRWKKAKHQQSVGLGADWHVFVSLLDAFLGVRLESQGVMSPGTKENGWMGSLDALEVDKQYHDFKDTITDGRTVINDLDNWSIWKLEEALLKFARPLLE